MSDTSRFELRTERPSWLGDGNTEVRLVSPLAVVVGTSTLRLASQAATMFLLDAAAVVVKGNSCVLLCAWIVAHRHHAFLVLHDMRIRAPGARILFDLVE